MTVCQVVSLCLCVNPCLGVKEGALGPIPQHTEFIRTVLMKFAKYVLAVAMSMMNAIMKHVQCVAHQLTALFQWILWTIPLDSEGSADLVDSVGLVDLVTLMNLVNSVDVDLDFSHFSHFSHSSVSVAFDGFEKE